MELTKKQEREIKKQEECKHKNIRELRVNDKKMLKGFYIDKECLDCGIKFLSFKVEIAFILKTIAREKGLKTLEEVTPEQLIKSSLIKPIPTIKEAKYLIQNKDKYLG